MPLSRHDHEHPSPVLPCPEGSNWLPDLSRRIILFIKDPLPPLGTALRPYARSKEKDTGRASQVSPVQIGCLFQPSYSISIAMLFPSIRSLQYPLG
jgi:hypothetical protein